MVSDSTASPWFRDAIFYEVSVRSFFDSSGDGIGDFRGLIEKLAYIQDLGATCIWLLPYFPSPLRDDGYDVIDYRDIHPSYGSIDDFRAFLQESHERGLRVVAEMVINHTSDQHPWFQAARRAPPDSTLRDFYLWSANTSRFANAEVLHPANSQHNWTWDEEAKAFFWHRFSSHQPDLNFDNELVVVEVLKVLRFWADIGIDGLCLNGAAYLAEKEGTSCEHLPETHTLLRRFRRELAADYPDLLLQAGVNSWPQESVAYFGEGNECQMAPHLALAQRIFLAVQQENRHPIVDILEQTPPLPGGCQWVTLLRNHDELTLRLATDEERDYLFREYAADPSMRRHSGILRRLAPLAENNRRRIELLFGLLFSLPGAPVIYYGDEIGMGDNVFLGDRRGVRTPMQWSSDRNAGFSRADFSRLFRPPVMDVPYGYQSVNVEAQQKDSSSLLHWMRRFIALRKSAPALSTGSIEMLQPSNPKILAFVRHLSAADPVDEPDGSSSDPVLVVINLSRVAQPVSLDLEAFSGRFPVELFGGTTFPPVGATPYPMTLAPHAFFWFRLQRTADDVSSRLAPVQTEQVSRLPTLSIDSSQNVFVGASREAIEREVLPGYLRSQRWFGGKARGIKTIRIADCGAIDVSRTSASLIVLDVTYDDGGHDKYFLPLATATGPRARELLRSSPELVLAQLTGTGDDGVLFDALADEEFCTALLGAIGEGREFVTECGTAKSRPTTSFSRLRGDVNDRLPVKRSPATSSNSLLFFGRRLLFKLFRRLEPGINPDFEIGCFLTEGSGGARTPPVAGALEYFPREGAEPYTLGIVQSLIANQGDGWQHAIDELGRYYERASSRMFAPDSIASDQRSLLELLDVRPPAVALEAIGSYLHAASMLGRRTAELHRSLASNSDNADFAPLALTGADMEMLDDDINRQGELAFNAIGDSLGKLTGEVKQAAEMLLERGPAALRRLRSQRNNPPQATKIRIHGDYHLGQVLWVNSDYIILDFEGEPTRSVVERRAKFSPIRDVAGMLRSYHYAAYAGLFSFAQGRPSDFERLSIWADLWRQWVSVAFLNAYLTTAAGADFIPPDPSELATLLDSYTLAKALYELVYELNNRPDWVRIPLSGVTSLLN